VILGFLAYKELSRRFFVSHPTVTSCNTPTPESPQNERVIVGHSGVILGELVCSAVVSQENVKKWGMRFPWETVNSGKNHVRIHVVGCVVPANESVDGC